MRYRSILTAAAVGSLVYAAGWAQKVNVPSPHVHSPVKRLDVYHDTSAPLRELVGGASNPISAHETLASSDDPISHFALGLGLVRSFPGIATPAGFMGTPWATDASGAAGPNHYVQTVNFSAAIYDKNGNTILGPFPTAQFWNG